MRFKSGFLVLVIAVACNAQCLQAEDPALALRMRGSIGLDKRTEVVTFGLRIGNRNIGYYVNGLSQPHKGLYETDTVLDAINIVKQGYSDGELRAEFLDTGGLVQVYPRKRVLHGVTVAGLPLDGMFLQGAINDGIFVDTLAVDGIRSRGVLDYNNFNGYYRSKRGLKFGNLRIGSSIPGSNVVMNHDNFIGQNRTTVTMVFGDWSVSGLVFFSDLNRTWVDSDGDSHTDNVATSGQYDLSITKVDGSAVNLARLGEKPTADDLTMRKFIAFYVLFSYDMLQ